MNNQFVKDSLLPDEKILATAKFHKIKHLLFTLPFVLLLGGFWLLDYERVLGTDLFWTSVSYAYSQMGSQHFLHYDGKTGEVTENGVCIGTVSSIYEFSELGVKKGYPTNKYSGSLIMNENIHYEIKTTATIIFVVISLFLTVLAYLLVKWINSKDEFVITNKRVIAKVGVIRRVSFELLIEQVESIEVHQDVIGRLLKYGTEMPCGVGASKFRIPFVVNPFEFRQHFYDLKKPQNN